MNTYTYLADQFHEHFTAPQTFLQHQLEDNPLLQHSISVKSVNYPYKNLDKDIMHQDFSVVFYFSTELAFHDMVHYKTKKVNNLYS